MSEHTKGILHLCTHENETILRDDGGWWVASARSASRPMQEDAANARRLLACWNNAEGMTTQEIEQGMPLVKVRDTINAQARALAASIERANKLESLVSECDAMLGKRPCQNSRCNELNAAHALLHEVSEAGFSIMPIDFSRNPSSLESRVSAYLDACDKPGEQNAS